MKDTFFTKDCSFYKTLFSMLIVVALQNLVMYSVNMVDNVMLGRYSQEALSGAATVNQLFFMVEQFALAISNTLVAISAQYWGQNRTRPIRFLSGIAMRLGIIISIIILLLCMFMPIPLLHIFTDSPDIINQASEYLSIIQWTFVLFIISNILMAVLRSVGTVKISFYVSLVSLGINIVLNYALIYGHFGFSPMGIRGAAISTLIARIVELAIVFFYVLKIDKKISVISKEFFTVDKELKHDFTKTFIPMMFSQVLWGVSVPMQTAILGHLSADAIAANSVATTFYQYLKVIVIAMSSTSAVMIGNSIGRGHLQRVKSDARTLSVIDVSIGILLAIVLVLLRNPLMSLYNLDNSATNMALHLIIIMAFVMVGMSYQMPVSFGIIQGAGDAKFTMKMNLISTWCIVMPLSILAAFWWKLPVEWVVICIQSDQIFKGLPTFIKFRRYHWIRKLTREEA
ncbi:MATE family efflux transporter [Eubacterium oxidoreducens]|uniref:Probable multidrug resistance protein NorM n=1 Tax=Eubacterium oxidoreducens TaxID=1732 RepID=A0A1G6A552_EUBOX|nr:MATE family efflux transporter [Eubacterium oxidoreducens]SDB03562.1 putative efflux protein, MATE family [Eubacterium oxidoreducens]